MTKGFLGAVTASHRFTDIKAQPALLEFRGILIACHQLRCFWFHDLAALEQKFIQPFGEVRR